MTEFKLGQTWRTRGGRICTIKTVEDYCETGLVIESDLYASYWHRLDGTSCPTEGIDHENDLIELLIEPTQPPRLAGSSL